MTLTEKQNGATGLIGIETEESFTKRLSSHCLSTNAEFVNPINEIFGTVGLVVLVKVYWIDRYLFVIEFC